MGIKSNFCQKEQGEEKKQPRVKATPPNGKELM